MEQPENLPRPAHYLYHMAIGFGGMLFAPENLKGIFLLVGIVALIFWLFSLWAYWDNHS